MGRSPLPYSLSGFQVQRCNPLSSTPPLLNKPSLHFGRHPIQPQEASYAASAQARHFSFIRSVQRRCCGPHSVPERCAARIHSGPYSRTYWFCHLHYQHTLHRLPSLWLRHAVWHIDRRNLCVVLLPLVPPPRHARCGLGLGTTKLRACMGHWRRQGFLRWHRGME